MAMTAMKVIKKRFPSRRSPSEVDRQHATAWLQDPAHLDGQLLSCFSRQMMKHYGGQHDVELSVGKRQRLSHCFFENDFNAGLSRFLLRPGNHLQRGIQSVDHACRPDLSFGGNNQSSCTAAHV